jgi:integrase
MQVGELAHLLIEDVDWKTGWFRIKNKISLGWRVKTGQQRKIPILPEVMQALHWARAGRIAGPLLLRRKFFLGLAPPLQGSLRDLEQVCRDRLLKLGTLPSRHQEAVIARQVWRDAGAIKADDIRQSFIRVMRNIGHPEASCPKSWRHSFATLLQDANVDPLIRQITLGHSPGLERGLWMTGEYTHTRPETQRQQIEAALRLWTKSLAIAQQKLASFR